MSAALVPGRIRRRADSSGLFGASTCSSAGLEPIDGLWGPNCNSGMGGGEGSRGELDGDTPERAGVTAAMMPHHLHLLQLDFAPQRVYDSARVLVALIRSTCTFPAY